MPNYHPVDVRYKGPSTAYRGSATARKLRETSPVARPAKSKATPAPAQAEANAPSPWRGNAAAQVRQIVRETASAAPKPMDALGGLFSVYRSIKRVYLGFILMIFLYFLLAGLFGGFGMLTTQVQSFR